jgi:hypothetical protein
MASVSCSAAAIFAVESTNVAAATIFFLPGETDVAAVNTKRRLTKMAVRRMAGFFIGWCIWLTGILMVYNRFLE